MKIKIMLFLLMSFFAGTLSVSADVCDKEHISQLKGLAEQIDVSYEYMDYSGEYSDVDEVDGGFPVNTYSISLNLMSDELYVSNDLRDYYFTDSKDGVINFYGNAGKLDLKIRSSRCAGYVVRNISLDLPKFNVYSIRSECKKLSEYDLDVCRPWYKGTINDKIFYDTVNKYLKEEKPNFLDVTVDFLKKYYLIIGGAIITLILVIVGIVIYRKRSVLE